jgi:hypothetical protein
VVTQKFVEKTPTQNLPFPSFPKRVGNPKKKNPPLKRGTEGDWN